MVVLKFRDAAPTSIHQFGQLLLTVSGPLAAGLYNRPYLQLHYPPSRSKMEHGAMIWNRRTNTQDVSLSHTIPLIPPPPVLLADRRLHPHQQ